MDRNTACRGRHTFRQRVERRADPVELASAVVRHDDAGGAVAHGEMRVFACEDAFDPDRQGGDGAEPREVGAPVEGCV